MKTLHVTAIALVATCAAATLRAQSSNTGTPAFRNEALSFEARAADIVKRLTLEEKVQQMKDVAPAIDRLGIPAYQWWNEALHGVARSGLATVFPQAIGLAATWDDALMFRTATVISDEGRAKYHEYIRNDSHQRYQGLTFWSPNINIFRDPRWGRGQETYGEDPFLTGQLATQFIRGLQGNDPKYFKTIATVKHYAVHSGPEPERHEFNAVVSERDLRETYLPHFEQGIVGAKAYSIMCAYNRLDGFAACGSDPLLKNILRGEWGFKGYVVSDCGAIDDIYLRHKIEKTAAAAAALAVKSGTDLDCGRVYPNLVQAVKDGLISEAQIDTSLKRLFLARMKLGMFDSPSKVKWASTPYTVLDQASHKALARDVARKSMVLLKNNASLLPLKKNPGTIAVIGPNSNEASMLLGNYNGQPSDPVTPLRGIREAVTPTTKVLYARGSDLADGFPVLDGSAQGMFFTSDGQPGLRVEYFTSRAMTGAPLFTETDTAAVGNWQAGAPRPGMNADDFGVRWSGNFRPKTTGTYRFALTGTMKFRLTLNDTLRVQSVYQQTGEFPDPRSVQSTPLQLTAGQSYNIRVEGEESYGDARLQLQWSPPNETLEAEAVAVAQQADVVVMMLGLTARLEGEEMPVQIDGFKGGDRTRIDLPAVQEKLLKRIVAVGKPTVLVLLNGSAVAINWANSNVPAILEAWYPGQAGGSAIADVLFGDYNPGGRLPVTFYKELSDLPPFENYDMTGRTYRFFKGAALYPFGYGLSYTTFKYGPLTTSASSLSSNSPIVASVTVTNTGTRTGDEVVQLYATHVGSKVDRPIRDLRGYQRITLKPGESRAVKFTVNAKSLAYWNATTQAWVVENESVRLDAGASSADIRSSKTISLRGR